MGTKVNNIIIIFPIKVLPNIIIETYFGTINKMVQKLYRNVVTLQKSLSIGHHVHISIFMIPTLDATFSQTPYTSPTHLWDTTIFLSGSTLEEQEKLQVDHMVTLNIFNNHRNIDIAANTLLLEAVYWCYLKPTKLLHRLPRCHDNGINWPFDGSVW